MMRCDDESIPDQLSPWLPTTASGVARQGTRENYARAGLSKNKRTMTGRGRELADMLERRNVDILCLQETKWKGNIIVV